MKNSDVEVSLCKKAEHIYITSKSLRECSKATGVHYNTIKRWAKANNWKEKYPKPTKELTPGMAYLREDYIKAELLYVLLGKSIKEISTEINVKADTIYKWSNTYRWKEKEARYNYGIENVITLCLYYIKELDAKSKWLDKELNLSDIDAINKLVSTITNCHEKISVPQSVRILHEFKIHLVSKSETIDVSIIKEIESFIETKIEQAAHQVLYVQTLKNQITKI